MKNFIENSADWRLKRGEKVMICCSSKETKAVRIAAQNLADDLQKVLKARAVIKEEICEEDGCRIVIHTAGIDDGKEWLENYLPQKEIQGTKTEFQKEGTLCMCRDGVLYLAGSDRRGTIYAIYDFCRFAGVSPWYYWADVPVKEKEELCWKESDVRTDFPSVEYRGVFINDEEELEHWAQLHMREDTIGVHTYEKIFELILRLKGNYIWPAMHVNSFNVKPENGALADQMGIVVGTSHCDMLMRSNNREWYPWLEKKGYQDAVYDYSVPGRNREILKEYWRESVQQNRNFEVSYTLGMRGIHDSGFEIRSLEKLEGEELRNAKIHLLEKVIGDQEKILLEELGKETLKTFVPYKEVLELYDHGLKVPEELTLIWSNDNYGHIRRYPNRKEQMRKGGNGIYYHNSYWAPPGNSYLFINSIPLAHTWNELWKAWENGIQKLWVLNIGGLKPLEEEISYFLQLGWEIGKPDAMTEDVDAWTKEWINETFSGNHGGEMADVLNSFYQLANVRKIEQMDSDVFSQEAYGDEASMRLNALEKLFERGNRVYERLPEQEKEAFFQLCLMKLHAAFLTSAMYYYADRSALCVREGKNRAAELYVKECRAYDDARRQMLTYYNKKMCGGKWDKILTPEDFPPPRTAMYPACVPPIREGKEELLVDCWNGEDEVVFRRNCDKWIQVAAGGEKPLSYRIAVPAWLEISEHSGTVETEKRILLRIQGEEKDKAGKTGEIQVFCEETGQKISIPVSVTEAVLEETAVDDGGMVSMKASDAWELQAKRAGRLGQANGWKEIPRLGRGGGSLVEAEKTDMEEERVLSYPFYLGSESGEESLLEIHRFPSLNSVGKIRVYIQVDEEEKHLLESDAEDEWRGNWEENVRNNVDRLTVKTGSLTSGRHVLRIFAVDPYFAFSKWVLYTQKRKENAMGGMTGNPQLPERMDLREKLFYGKIQAAPRDVIYGARMPVGNSLADEDTGRKALSRSRNLAVFSRTDMALDSGTGSGTHKGKSCIKNRYHAFGHPL